MGQRDVSRVTAKRAYTPNQILPSPPLLSPAHPHSLPLNAPVVHPDRPLTPALPFTVPATFHPETLGSACSSPRPQSQPDSLFLCFSLPPPLPPNPTHLQLSDGHDLLPSQFHLTQLQSGQLCHPVPALLGRTRGHPTGPGPGPRSRKPKWSQQSVSKEKQELGPLLPQVGNFVLLHGKAPSSFT